MFIAGGILKHGTDMNTTLVRKCGLPYKGLAQKWPQVGDFSDIGGSFFEFGQFILPNGLIAELEFKVGYDGAEVCITATLAISVHGSLNLDRTVWTAARELATASSQSL